jgi:hypothetical protein
MGVHYQNLVKSLSPSVYLRLNEASGGVVYDHSGNALDGTYTNGALGQPGAIAYDPATGWRSGTGGYAKLNSTTAARLSTTAFTVNVWIRKPASPAYQGENPGILRKPDQVEGGWGIYSIGHGDYIAFKRTYHDAGFVFTGITDGAWHMLTFLLGGGALCGYKDGALVGWVFVGAYATDSSTGALHLGVMDYYFGDWYFQDASIWTSTTLSEAQLAALNAAGRQKFIDLNRQSEAA